MGHPVPLNKPPLRIPQRAGPALCRQFLGGHPCVHGAMGVINPYNLFRADDGRSRTGSGFLGKSYDVFMTPMDAGILLLWVPERGMCVVEAYVYNMQ